MEQSPPLDPEIVGWLTTLGVTSLCQWDVLVFLYRHHTTLLGAEDLARLLGYTSNTIVIALDGLETQELVARSRVSQGVRLYQVRVLPDSPRGVYPALHLRRRPRGPGPHGSAIAAGPPP